MLQCNDIEKLLPQNLTIRQFSVVSHSQFLQPWRAAQHIECFICV